MKIRSSTGIRRIVGAAFLLVSVSAGAGLISAGKSGQHFSTYVDGAPYQLGFSAQLDEVFFPGQRLRASVASDDEAPSYGGLALFDGDLKVGYVPSTLQATMLANMSRGLRPDVMITKVNGDDPWRGVQIEIRF